MSSSSGGSEPATLSPSDAFNLLGNETRLQILGVLATADGPLSFTQLRDRVGLRRGAEFNYHLDKVVGQFVDKTEEGYSLRLPGSRVVQAVLSTAVTEDPTIQPTALNKNCYHCGESIQMRYDGSHIAIYCTECSGNYNLVLPDWIEQADVDENRERIGFLGGFELPPAGVQARSEGDMLQAGVAWQNLERMAASKRICPRCSGKLDTPVQVCESHDATEGFCKKCQNRYAVRVSRTCRNCNYHRWAQISRMLLGTTELLSFLTEHEVNPISPESPIEFMSFLDNYEEEVMSVEPFEGRFTFSIDEESITLIVDNNLNVIGIEQGKSTR